jgi:hypothetical protein
MHLAAVMGLVVEQVGQHVAGAVALHMVAARHLDPGVEDRAIQPVAKGHQPKIAVALAPQPFGGTGTGSKAA